MRPRIMGFSECSIIWLSILILYSDAAKAEEFPSQNEEEYIIRGPNFSASTLKEMEGETLDQSILALTKRRINDTFIIDAITNEKLGWKEFIEKGLSLAAKLQEFGCSTGCIVGIISENRVEYPIVYLGSWLSGATLNNFDILSPIAELIRLYGITKPSIIFGPAEHCERLRTGCPTCTFVVFDSDSTMKDAWQFASLIKDIKKPFKPVQISPDDTAFIMYSSGTTGLPKAIQMSHKGLVYLNKLFHEQKMPEKDGGTMVSDRGFCHGMGLVIFLVAVVRNQTLVIMPKAEEKNHDEELFLKIIEQYGVNMIITVPATVLFILKDPVASKYDLPSLEYIVSSASPLTPELEEAIKERLTNLKGVIQFYGSTESMLNTTKAVDNPKSGTVGSVNPIIEVKVVDLETKKSLENGKRGEIWIRGPTITKGYYGNPEVTALAIDQDGWYHSGDIGYYDEDKDFFIIGRLKEVIRYKSYPVVPAEIEGVLLQHPAVFDCAAVGIPDERFTELPRAYVIKKSGENVTEEDLVEFVQEQVSPYAYLRGGVEFVSKLPKTTTGKVIRKELQDMWKAAHGYKAETVDETANTNDKRHLIQIN